MAKGTLALIHNTLLSSQPEDKFFFSHPSATTELLLFNNVFSVPGRSLFEWHGSGSVQGAGNFIPAGLAVPAGLIRSIVGAAPGFVDPDAGDFRLRADSACRDAGASDPLSRNAAGHLVRTLPTHEPRCRHPGATERRAARKLDIGAFEYVLG